MTTYFKMIGQVNTRADYDKILRKALSTPGQEPFHYFDAYPFDKKEAPLLLVGDIAKPLLTDLKKAAPKAQYAKGVCTVSDSKDEILFDRQAGKLQPKLVASALKLAGIKHAIEFGANAEGEDEDTEQESTDEQAVSSSPQPKAPAVQAQAPDSDRPREWQDKVKAFRPEFDQALKKARALPDDTWAEDLDSNFTQMVQEAKSGNFEAALATLDRLTRMVKSEAAARKEVMQQFEKVREEEAKAKIASTRAPAPKPDAAKQGTATTQGTAQQGAIKPVSQGSKSTGPIRRSEWKSVVIDGLNKLNQVITADPLDVDALRKLREPLEDIFERARAHPPQGDDKRKSDYEEALDTVQNRYGAFEHECDQLVFANTQRKTPEEMVQACDALRDNIRKSLGKPKKQPDQREIDQFLKQAPQRKQARESELKQLGESLKWIVERISDLQDDLQELPEDSAGKKERQEIERNIAKLKQDQAEGKKALEIALRDHRNDATESNDVAQFRKGDRQSDDIEAMLKAVDSAKAFVQKGNLELATDAISNLAAKLTRQGFGQEALKEKDVISLLNDLDYDLDTARLAGNSSSLVAARYGKRFKAGAEKFAHLLE